jgi:hypothetical protein
LGEQVARRGADVRSANDGLRFLLELTVLVSVGSWGFRATDSALRWLLMVAAPVAVAAVWATCVAAKSSSALHDSCRLLLEIAVFATGAAALVSTGRTTFAVVLAALSVAHLAVTFVEDQRRPTALARPVESALVSHSHESEVR